MSDITEETIRTLSHLCRIACSEEEIGHLQLDLEKVVGYIDLLDELDTEGVTPCNNVLAEITNVMREDVVGSTLSRDTFLANAPSQVAGMVKVPPVIKGHQS